MRTFAGPRQSGLTLMELLVTIIIAGIAFAALVPVFVQALESNASDKARNVALNIAQAKIELIRELDFAQLDTTTPDSTSPTTDPAAPGFLPKYLGSATFHNKDFAATYDEVAAAGKKTFWVHYTVTPVKNAPTDSQPAYKRVRVTVGWDGAPKPLKTAVLETIIYGQWGGPRIAFFDVESYDENGIITSGTARLKAVIESSDIPRTTTVTFAITSKGGIVVPWKDGVKDPADGTGGTWYFDWPTTGVADGLYTFKAIAYAGFEAGNTFQRILRVESGPPATPTNLNWAPGDRKVLLRWDPSPAGDLARFEVWVVPEAQYVASTPVDQQATRLDVGEITSEPLYSATGLTNLTAYRFFVRAIDDLNNASGWAEVVGTPDPNDKIPPAAPTDLWFSVLGDVVTLSWTPSTSPDIAYYTVYTWNGSAASPMVGLNTVQSSQSIIQGYSKTSYYQVRAVDAAQNEQLAWCPLRLVPTVTPSAVLDGVNFARAITLAPPSYVMTLQNTLSGGANVTVKYLKDGPSTPAADQVTILNGKNVPSSKTKDLGSQFSGYYSISWTSSGPEPSANGTNLYHFISADYIPIPVP